ncbi:Sulfate permease [Cyclobacterium qasimii M12-11B]|nr:Sulfate permease [Cyclobacterium qasimii M12-11B]
MNTGIGDLIPLKVAANILDTHLIETIEISCRKQHAKLILIMGNTPNKLIAASLKNIVASPNAPESTLLAPSLKAKIFEPKDISLDNLEEWSDRLVRWNLEYSKALILASNPYLNSEIKKGNIGLCSALFNRQTGRIEFSTLHMHESLSNNNSLN